MMEAIGILILNVLEITPAVLIYQIIHTTCYIGEFILIRFVVTIVADNVVQIF